MPKLIIFDLDGTLLNTLEDLADAANHVLAAHHFPTHPVDAYCYFVGNGMPKLIERILPEEHRQGPVYDACFAEFLAYYKEHMHDKTTVYPGITELLERLQQLGVMLAVATNKVHEAVAPLMANLFPTIRWDALFGQRPGVPVKPDPAVVADALTAGFGSPVQQIIILDAFQVDTTPLGPAAPVFGSIAPSDTDYDKIFLGREVTVSGENFASIESFIIDGVEAELSGDPTDIEARFVVPRTIAGNAAKQVSLIAVWDGGNQLDCGEITLYPFYYTKGLRLGKGCGKAIYTAFDSSNAFLMLDDGVVISADDWKNNAVDATCTDTGNSLVTASSRIATGKETEYYAAKPYVFMSVTSNTQLQFNNPANSNSQLKNHRLSDLSTALPSAYGTPVVFMGAVNDEGIKTAVAGGTLSDIADGMPLLGTSAPRWKQHYDKGDVVGVQYLKYDHVSTTGGKATDASHVYKTGYMYIRDITTPLDGSNIGSGGYVEVDLYWSNAL